MEIFAGLAIAAGVVVYLARRENQPTDGERMAAAQENRPAQTRAQMAAQLQERIVCPHCHQRGQVTKSFERRAKRKTATRIITGTATLGASLPVTGVSKKGTVQVLSCGNCGMTWDIENARP